MRRTVWAAAIDAAVGQRVREVKVECISFMQNEWCRSLKTANHSEAKRKPFDKGVDYVVEFWRAMKVVSHEMRW